MNTRPVRLAPWAAGANPTTTIRAAGSPKPGTVTHTLNRDIDWRYALWLTVGVVPGARLGTAVALRTDERRLRVVFGWFLLAIAVYYGIREGLSLGS